MTEVPAAEAPGQAGDRAAMVEPLDGRGLVDGWVARHTAVEEAAALGAEEVYVLPTGYTCDLPPPPLAVIASALRMFDLAFEQRLVTAVEQAPAGVRVRVVPPLCPAPVLPFDFRHGHILVARARRATEQWLRDGRPVAGLSRPLGAHDHRRSA